MIKNVHNISRKKFHKINFYPVSNGPKKDTHCYVSIYGYDSIELVPPKINYRLWMSGIQIQFDDIDSVNHKDNHLFMTDEQADTVVRYLNGIHQIEAPVTLVVHCFAGVSRSAAVGKFTNDIFNLDLPGYRMLQVYNKAVYRSLAKSWERLSEPNQ